MLYRMCHAITLHSQHALSRPLPGGLQRVSGGRRRLPASRVWEAPWNDGWRTGGTDRSVRRSRPKGPVSTIYGRAVSLGGLREMLALRTDAAVLVGDNPLVAAVVLAAELTRQPEIAVQCGVEAMPPSRAVGLGWQSPWRSSYWRLSRPAFLADDFPSAAVFGHNRQLRLVSILQPAASTASHCYCQLAHVVSASSGDAAAESLRTTQRAANS